MDSITQATLGASVSHAILGNRIGPKAALIGAVIGTIPDLDVLITPFLNEYQKISFHRGFSHSLVFSVACAFLFAILLKKISITSGESKLRLFSVSFLVLFTHILLDAFTTYGTQLFLPFSNYRVSFDSINIVDPVYTVPLLLGLVLSLIIKHRKRSSLFNHLGIILSSVYLIFTLYNKKTIEAEFHRQFQEQNFSITNLLTVPVKVGNVKWYGVVKDETNLYIGHYSKFENNRIAFESFPINEELLKGLDDALVKKLKWFAQGFYTVSEYEGKIRVYNMQCDMQGVRTYGDYKAPTAFFYEIELLADDSYNLGSGMHEN